MMEPLVSVVIPAYNAAGYITQAIDSALAQNVELELIVVDDASTDGLDELIERYCDEPRLRYLKNEKNMGVAFSRNRGVNEARAEYVAFLDADDIWRAGKLSRQLELIREKGTVICSTARELMRMDGSTTRIIIPVKPEYTYEDLLIQNEINCSSVLIKTSVAKEFPMYHEDCHEDYFMWLRVLGKYRRGCAINEPLLLYRVSTTGKSGNKLKSAGMTYKTLRRAGFGHLKCMKHFISYAYYGVKKYFFWFLWR